MLHRKLLFFLTGLTLALCGCQDEFLQLPISSATNVDSVFSTTIKAQSAIAEAYQKNLSQGLPYQGFWNSMIHENLTGGLNFGFAWTISNGIIQTGMNATGSSQDMDGFGFNYTAIRQALLVKENIDRVRDMSSADKAIVKAEMNALVAYRYGQMLTIWGGVPMVSRSFLATEDLNVPRSSVAQVLDSVVTWCDQAATVLPSRWPDTFSGRMTKAGALAIKAKAQLYAARPLFNTGQPYLAFGANNSLICLGSADPTRWTKAAQAAEAVIAEAEGKGGFKLINTGNPLEDYGTATAKPGNDEVILAYKANNSWQMNTFYNAHNWQAYGNVLLTSQLENYYRQDGTNQTWPAVGASLPFSDYLTKMNQMEARFKASFQPWQMDSWGNPGDNTWSNQTMFQWETFGCARSTKFYYKAGSRGWFEFPIFRVAAAYLSAAEAYNEAGQTALALERLNKVHVRAGLPVVTASNQATLRAIIQREWAIEFFSENYRLQDMKHWRLSNIGQGIIGGPIRAFTYNDGKGAKLTGNTNFQDYVWYQGFWSPNQYLNPFPQTEVNKGIITQNPGY